MKIRYGSVVCVALCLALVLGGCTAMRALPDYRRQSFLATVRWESEGVTVRATLEAVCEEGEMAHLRRVTLSAPVSLDGATLEASEKGIVMTVDGIGAVSAGAQRIWEMCRMLVAEGDLKEVCDTEWQGMTVRYSEIIGEDGICGIFRDNKTGAPRHLKTGERVLTVERFVHT